MDGNDLLEIATSVVDADARRAWERRCDERLESLREECRRRNNVGTVNFLVARIARLEGAKDELRRRFERVGAGYVDEEGGHSWVEIDTAFDKRVSTGAVINKRHIEPRQFLDDARDTVLAKVRDNLDRHACLKVNTVFNGEFVANDKTSVKSIVTRNRQLFRSSDLREWYDRHVVDVTLVGLEEFQERDSGWALSRILNIVVNINKCNPMRAGCWIDMPQFVQLKKAVINVRTTDNACFAWAVVAALYPVNKHAGRCSQYPDYRTVLKLDGIDFPMNLKQIGRFERLNDISVNVFTQNERGDNAIVSLRLTDDKRDTHVNLFYVSSSSEPVDK